MTATVLEYDDFRITFERSGDVYPIVASGRAAEASATFRPPFSDIEIENLVLKLNRPRTGGRRTDSSDVEVLRRFGRELFEALFTGPVRDVYRTSLHTARSRGIGMRIGLALGGTPELMHVPWELLYDEPTFLSISTWTPVVRCLELATPSTPLNVDPPVRILAMVSSPSDLAPLAIEKERATLEGSLDRLSGRGLVQIQWLERATLQALLRALRQGDFHIFHFVGHGRGYDRTTDDGTLTLEDSVGRSRLVTGTELGTILADQGNLRLAVLNACQGRSSISDPFSGVAMSLVRHGIPSVVAMQLEISDHAAMTFGAEFYTALADGFGVDAALVEARKAIFAADANAVEWATPVLFTRSSGGRIFHLPKHNDVVDGAEQAHRGGKSASAYNRAERHAREPATVGSPRLFISYSHKDRVWLERLRSHLAPSLREGSLEIWDDTMIRSGSRWRQDIEEALDSAGIAVLLVSPDFLDSEFIAAHELPPLLEAARENGLEILWIPLRYSRFDKTEIGEYQAAHSPEKPLAALRPAARDKALVEISRKIDDAARRSGAKG